MDVRAQEIICKVVDGKATAEEEKELEALMSKHPELREVLESQRNVNDVLRSVGLRELQDDIADSYWASVYNRMERKAGWVILTGGLLMLGGYGLYEFTVEHNIHAVYRVGVLAVVVGALLVFSGVFKLKKKQSNKDKYSGVIR